LNPPSTPDIRRHEMKPRGGTRLESTRPSQLANCGFKRILSRGRKTAWARLGRAASVQKRHRVAAFQIERVEVFSKSVAAQTSADRENIQTLPHGPDPF
jgi:hypothetical protein